MIDNHVGVLLKIINITSLCKAKFPYYAVKYEQTIFFGFSLFIYMICTHSGELINKEIHVFFKINDFGHPILPLNIIKSFPNKI